MAQPYAVNKTFDPFDQTFILKAPDGVTDIVASLADVRFTQESAVNQSICQGVQFGAAIILLIALLLMTKTDKRRSIVFLLNALALLLVVVRASLSFAVYTGPFYNLYRNEAIYYANTGGARAVSSATEVFTFLLTACIEASLILQVRIVCCNLEPRRRHSVNTVNTAVAFTATVMRFVLMVVNIHWGLINPESETIWQANTINTLASATNIMQVVSIGVSAVIFCAKLAYAIESRRSMGMTQFGPMQIIFIMGCQTMCTPLIFTLLAYYAVKNAQISSFVPCVVAISLPLSAMWAAANTRSIHIASPDARNRAIPVTGDVTNGQAFGDNKDCFKGGSVSSTGTDTSGKSDTLVDDSNTDPNSPAKTWAESDVEMQRFGRYGSGVQVDRTYSVRSD